MCSIMKDYNATLGGCAADSRGLLVIKQMVLAGLRDAQLASVSERVVGIAAAFAHQTAELSATSDESGASEAARVRQLQSTLRELSEQYAEPTETSA